MWVEGEMRFLHVLALGTAKSGGVILVKRDITWEGIDKAAVGGSPTAAVAPH